MTVITNLTNTDVRDYFYKDSLFSSITDKEINRALLEAKSVINESLIDDNDQLKICFYYLTAHFACLNTRMGGVNSVGQNIIMSESAEGVSANYAIPEAFIKNPVWAAYTKTEYGYRYLSLIYPYTVGNIVSIEGATTP